MRVKTAAVGSLVVLAVAGGAMSLTNGAQSGSREMAKPRKMKIPTDGRARVISQLCWYPDSGVQMAVGWKLGPGASGLSFDTVGTPLNCQTPWSRTAVLGAGDQAVVSWTLTKGAMGRVQYRITVNNRPRVYGDSVRNAGGVSCVIGTPPCELP